MRARLLWRLDALNHFILRRFNIRALCDANERAIWEGPFRYLEAIDDNLADFDNDPEEYR